MAALLLALPLLSGCTNSLPVQLSPEERVGLGQRALALLLRAARSDVDIVACNAIEALVNVAPQDGLSHFRAALSAEAPLIRFAGCVALGELRDRAALGSIKHCLRDPEPRVRLAAAFAATRCGETGWAGRLVEALNNDRTENLRADAAFLIGRLGEPRAKAQLRAALGNKTNQDAKVVALQIYGALARLGDQDAGDMLIEYAQYDALSRLLALQILCEVGSADARDTFVYRLNSSDDYVEARLIAARGLAKLGAPAGYELAVRAARQATADPDETMRIRSLAALALGEMGERRALPVLQQLAESQDDPRVQVAACYAICKIVNAPPPG
ncbi:MAG: HEAT repeat domain-containing protein [Planctomycetes bacterium]|nr:HEAT repeat domain-containing protein [Planctomycetota bacterium]